MSGEAVIICDVGPRDGLQNEPLTLSPEVRAELAARLAAAGVTQVEVASFVRPDRVPQMAGAEEVVAALPADAATWSGLVLNERGYERALACGLRAINYTVAASETFCQRNQGSPREQATAAAERLAQRALADGVELTVTVAVAFGCPFEGPVPPARLQELNERLAASRPARLVLADTIGVAVPTQVAAALRAAAGLEVELGCHLHDTRNTGVANALAAIEAGATLLDTSIGGTGGCPFAPRATGNLATEDLVYVLDGIGVETGIELDALFDCSAWLGERLGRELPSAVSRAGRFVPSA